MLTYVSRSRRRLAPRSPHGVHTANCVRARHQHSDASLSAREHSHSLSLSLRSLFAHSEMVRSTMTDVDRPRSGSLFLSWLRRSAGGNVHHTPTYRSRGHEPSPLDVRDTPAVRKHSASQLCRRDHCLDSGVGVGVGSRESGSGAGSCADRLTPAQICLTGGTMKIPVTPVTLN